MNDFCDLLGTPYAPVSKIAPVKEGLYQFQIFIAKQENYLFALRLDLASL